MSGGFVKLYSSITSSSVWSESKEVRVLWITMLAEAGPDGVVAASVPGIARFANLTVEECEAALVVLEAPDKHSRTKDDEGRRIRPVDGGWLVLNHQKYRDMRSPSQVAEAERKAAYRERMKQASGTCPECPDESAEIQTEADGEVEVEAKAEDTTPTTPARDLDSVAGLFPKPGHAKAMLKGMLNGLGAPKLKPVSLEVLLEAADEIMASGGDVTPHRFKAFVEKILNRANAPRGQPQRNGQKTKESRSRESLGEWLAEQDDQITDAEVVPDGQ